MELSRGSGYLAITILVAVLSIIVVGSQARGSNPNALSNLFTTWTPENCNFSTDGRGLDLVLKTNTTPWASLASKQSFLYGGIGAWIKLAAGNSAGTVTTFYLSSNGPAHCEFDYEFLGNVSGQPYILHTNIFVEGVGGREIQFYLWFDPTLEYHYYNFQWNKDLLVFYVDNTPIRMFRNLAGIVPSPPFPVFCPMQLYLSMWDGSNWATQGGRVKLNWTDAPFIASYQYFKLNGCPAIPGNNASISACQKSPWASPGYAAQTIGTSRTRKLRYVKANYVHYNYCADTARYPTLPPECDYNIL